MDASTTSLLGLPRPLAMALAESPAVAFAAFLCCITCRLPLLSPDPASTSSCFLFSSAGSISLKAKGENEGGDGEGKSAFNSVCVGAFFAGELRLLLPNLVGCDVVLAIVDCPCH
eukprot:1102675-Prorocentrum_lima.AAC.1